MIGKALMGTGVTALTVGMGAAAGAYQGQTEGNAATGATVGGIAGLGLGVGTVAVGLNSQKIAGGIGDAAIKVGAKAYSFVESGGLKDVGVAAINGAKTVGASTLYGGYKAVEAATPVASTMALKAGAKYGNIATSMFRVNPDFLTKESGRMLNFTKRGAAMFGVATVAGMGVSGVKAFNQSKVGVSDGQVTSATPNGAAYSSNMRNAGATGDLAFAMRAQRNG